MICADRYRFLIANQSPFIRKWLMRGLSATGAELLEASTGSELWAIVGSDDVDLLITDPNMLSQTGLEAFMAGRVVGLQLPFVLITAFHTDEVRALAEDVGADVLSMPFTAVQLVKCVQAIFPPRTSGLENTPKT